MPRSDVQHMNGWRWAEADGQVALDNRPAVDDAGRSLDLHVGYESIVAPREVLAAAAGVRLSGQLQLF
jgi:hypothetical protein